MRLRASFFPDVSIHLPPIRPLCALLCALLTAAAPLARGAAAHAATWSFTDVTAAAGFTYQHGFNGGTGEAHLSSGGVAVGDYDGDGWDDLYVVRGNIGANLLFRNLGNGTFDEVAAAAGVAVSGEAGCGPSFADCDGDGWLDLFIGGVGGTQPRVYRNDGDGTFTDVTAGCGIESFLNTFSFNHGDYDRDGDLDVFLSHWDAIGSDRHLWRNNGDGTYTAVDDITGIGVLGSQGADYTFTGNFADINNDGWPDLLVASDFDRSRVFVNTGLGTFADSTSTVISDENGMGAAIGDYDNDGDLDWFVSSIWDPDSVAEGIWGITGNRLYRNIGDGVFEDATDEAGVRLGYWGWGSSFVDLNNDGHLDLFHVNGWDSPDFVKDPSRLFVSNGDGTFTEMAFALGIADSGQGRGIACFDHDHDGDLDIFIANNSQGPRFYRNDGGNDLNFLSVLLRGTSPNTMAVGARIHVTIGADTYIREISAGSNFVSQNQCAAHFGLGSASTVDELLVVWPNGDSTVVQTVAANQFLVIGQGGSVGVAATPPALAPPAELRMAPPAPNPFSASTTVQFELARGAMVSVRVVSSSGRAVRSRHGLALPAGAHTWVWDGTDDSGARAAAGVYFLQVESPTSRAVRRVTLLR